ncbi:hypothetical protein D3C71_1262550 [compost metagenome]
MSNSIIDNSNEIPIINIDIIDIGRTTTIFTKIFDQNIFFSFTGNDLINSIFLPSNDILEDVVFDIATTKLVINTKSSKKDIGIPSSSIIVIIVFLS